jgi:hypothetical protein
MHSAHHLEPPPVFLAIDEVLLGVEYSTPFTIEQRQGLHVMSLVQRSSLAVEFVKSHFLCTKSIPSGMRSYECKISLESKGVFREVDSLKIENLGREFKSQLCGHSPQTKP